MTNSDIALILTVAPYHDTIIVGPVETDVHYMPAFRRQGFWFGFDEFDSLPKDSK